VDRVSPRHTVQPPAPHPRRAVCRIKWIRRHGTFPSCRLRRKLHGTFSYAAGNAASYTLAPFRQDGAWICWTEESRGQARKSRNEIYFACNVIMYEQNVFYTTSIGPTYRGPNGHVRVSLEI